MRTDLPLLLFIAALGALLYIYIADTVEDVGQSNKTTWTRYDDTRINKDGSIEPAVYHE